MTDLPKLSAPAHRALAAAGLHDLEAVAGRTEAQLADLHGMGPKALDTLRDALASSGLGFAPRQAGGLDFDDVVALTASWPGVAVGTSYGSPAVLVEGRSFGRMWRDSEHKRDGVHDSDVLVVRCELDLKEQLLAGGDGVLFSTPHYQSYGAVRIRLADVDRRRLSELLEDSYDLCSELA